MDSETFADFIQISPRGPTPIGRDESKSFVQKQLIHRNQDSIASASAVHGL